MKRKEFIKLTGTTGTFIALGGPSLLLSGCSKENSLTGSEMEELDQALEFRNAIPSVNRFAVSHDGSKAWFPAADGVTLQEVKLCEGGGNSPGDVTVTVTTGAPTTGLEQLFRKKKALSRDQFKSLGKLMLDPKEDEALRMMAIHILGRSKDERALEPLKDLFCQFPLFPARHLIIKALGDLGLLEARQILVEALATEDKIGDRTHAASALEHPDITPAERQALKAAVLSDASELVQLAALRVLARAKQDHEFLQSVVEMTTLPNNVRILARRGLERAPRPIA